MTLFGEFSDCFRRASTNPSPTPGKPTDPNAGGCVDKAKTKYNGGADPTKGCFSKLEAKKGNDCRFTKHSGAVQGVAETCLADLVAAVTNTTTTTTTTSTTTTTCPPPTPPIVRGSLTATPGRFNYAGQLGLDGANLACASAFACTHACTLMELQSAGTAELMGLKDTANMAVTSFWAIDPSADPLQQCNDDAAGGSGENWEYGTAHTPSRGQKIDLNADGTLGTTVQMSLQCNFSGNAWVGCCR